MFHAMRRQRQIATGRASSEIEFQTAAVALLPNTEIVQFRAISATWSRKDHSIIGLGSRFVALERNVRLGLM
jgi:hypothetical protein